MLYRALLTSLFVAGMGATFPDLHDLDDDIPNDLPMGNLEDIRFLLWTRSNPEDHEYYRLVPDDLDGLLKSPLYPTLPTYVFYHGFACKGMVGWIRQAKTELLKLYKCNVISVDWQSLANFPWYIRAVKNTYRTARYTASLLDWLATVGLKPAQLHIIGHSLGAHGAGLTAKYITGGTVARVTGLDPAGPLFYTKPPGRRIDKSDARFVDILHTNSGSLLEGCVGLSKRLGHVDFYPNGGKHQPGCIVTRGNELSSWIGLIVGCSHNRSTKLWVESIAALPPVLTFTSWPCPSWHAYISGNCSSCGQGCLDMGHHVQKHLQGTYFLRTNPKPPFALGDTQ